MSNNPHSIVYSYDGITWTGADNIYSNNGESITYGKRIISIGGYGSVNTMAYSYDGINWTGLGKSSTNGIHTDRCRAVAFGNNMFVSGGDDGDMLNYSYDGINWNWGTNGSSIFNKVRGIAYGNNMWVAVGSGTNTIAYSTNGIDWTANGKTIFTGTGYAIAYHDGLYGLQEVVVQILLHILVMVLIGLD